MRAASTRYLPCRGTLLVGRRASGGAIAELGATGNLGCRCYPATDRWSALRATASAARPGRLERPQTSAAPRGSEIGRGGANAGMQVCNPYVVGCICMHTPPRPQTHLCTAYLLHTSA